MALSKEGKYLSWKRFQTVKISKPPGWSAAWIRSRAAWREAGEGK